MAISKEKKVEIVAKLAEACKEASAMAFVGFTKLTVADASKLRKQLKEAGVRYLVAKKTLIRLVLNQQGYEGQMPELPGEVAVAWTSNDDVTSPTHGIYDFGKKMKGALSLLGGVFEKAFISAEKAIAIATIPALPVLRGMFVNVINSPIQGLVVALDKIREQKA